VKEDRRNDREILRHVVGDRERGQRAACHQQLLADFDTSISWSDWNPGPPYLPASRAAFVPVFMATPTSACASAGASLVPFAAMAPASLGLLVANELQLVLRSRLRKEVIDAGFGGNRGCRHRIVAGDHHGADAHAAQFGKTLADAPFTMSFR